jgi:hypothetical protein
MPQDSSSHIQVRDHSEIGLHNVASTSVDYSGLSVLLILNETNTMASITVYYYISDRSGQCRRLSRSALTPFLPCCGFPCFHFISCYVLYVLCKCSDGSHLGGRLAVVLLVLTMLCNIAVLTFFI